MHCASKDAESLFGEKQDLGLNINFIFGGNKANLRRQIEQPKLQNITHI